MNWIIMLIIGALLLVWVAAWTYRAMRRGATPEEIESAGTGDAWLEGVPGARLQMTRGISIKAPPETVWLWLGQNGRGAGWHSYEAVDNGGRASARHIVSWIPEPCVGDAAAIGYLRHLEPGRELVWWAPDLSFLGARTWSAWAYRLVPEGDGSRLVMRVDVAAAGAMRFLVILLLPLIDSMMALRQLRNLRDLAERHGARGEDPENPETGKRDQYQLHHVIYASGEEAGVPGKENARKARDWAKAAGIV
ncbi:MAG: hypothetical protein QNK37_16405 [Acidobacteriota bacterium]|nr:hypothetical protein [Acidobacteriota bacterium]